MSARRRAAVAWALNLDCEAQLQFGASYTRGPAVREGIERATKTLRAMGLVAEDDLIVDPDRDPDTAVPSTHEGMRGVAWCPTPQALEALNAAGARCPVAPTPDVLRRVNARAFGVRIEAELAHAPTSEPHASFGARMVYDMQQLREAVDLLAPGPVLLKRELSFAGRGHRRLFAAFDEADGRWATNSFVDGLGLVCEPYVERVADYALHGWVSAAGQVRLGRPTLQRCDPKGVWQSSEPAPRVGALALSTIESTTLHETAEAGASALHDAGYFGPFGIDAFRWREGDRDRFRPFVELNARYSMGWATSGLALDAW